MTMAFTFQAIWAEVNSCDHSCHYSSTFPIHFSGNFAKVSHQQSCKKKIVLLIVGFSIVGKHKQFDIPKL